MDNLEHHPVIQGILANLNTLSNSLDLVRKEVQDKAANNDRNMESQSRKIERIDANLNDLRSEIREARTERLGAMVARSRR